MTPKIEIIGQKFAHFGTFEGSFRLFLGSKKSFSGLFKVVLEVYRKCLGIVFDLKGLLLGYFFSSKGR